MTALHRIFVLRERKHAEALWTFLKANWEAMAAAGKPLVVELSEEKSKRSIKANRYYFGAVLKQISEQVWLDGRSYSVEAWHETAKRKFLGVVDLPGGGTAGISSADLPADEFDAFTKEVEVWAATELGVTFIERLEPMGRAS